MGTNYTMFSKIEDNNEILNEENDTVEMEEIVEDISDQEANTEDEYIMGKVSCDKLYVRTEPYKDSAPLTIIEKNDEIMILSSDDQDFYHICTAAGIEGYVVKTFISIEE